MKIECTPELLSDREFRQNNQLFLYFLWREHVRKQLHPDSILIDVADFTWEYSEIWN